MSLIACMILLSIPDFGYSQESLYREFGKKVFDSAALIAVEQVTEYGLEQIFGNLSNNIHANPISVNIYNPHNAVSHISVSENGQKWYDLRIPRGYYVRLRTEYYPVIAVATRQGNFYYLTRPGTYYVPPYSF